MSPIDEETQGLLSSTHKRTKRSRLLIVAAAVLVLSSVGLVVSLYASSNSGTK